MGAAPAQLERAMACGGEMGARLREHDWPASELGPPSRWPECLVCAVSLCLTTGFPMVVNWGRELVQIYNDAAVPVYANKHPAALGQPARTNFPEFWSFSSVEEVVRGVMESGAPFRAEDQRVLLERRGLLEEAYFTFSLSPILGEDGKVLGILNTYVETTARVLGARRMATLRALAERGAHARDEERACREAASALSCNPYDLRFVLAYLLDERCATARLVASTGIDDASVPAELALGAPADDPFALRRVVADREPVVVPLPDAIV